MPKKITKPEIYKAVVLLHANSIRRESNLSLLSGTLDRIEATMARIVAHQDVMARGISHIDATLDKLESALDRIEGKLS